MITTSTNKRENGASMTLDWINQRLNKAGNETFHVLVRNEGTSLRERLAGLLLNICLCIPNHLCKDGDNLGHELGGLEGCTDDELVRDNE